MDLTFVHTADWLVGGSPSLPRSLERQRRGLEFLVRYVIEREIHLVLVCGNVFDDPDPTADALEVVADTLGELERAKITTILMPGERDIRRLPDGERARHSLGWLRALRGRGWFVMTILAEGDKPEIVSSVGESVERITVQPIPCDSRSRWPAASIHERLAPGGILMTCGADAAGLPKAVELAGGIAAYAALGGAPRRRLDIEGLEAWYPGPLVQGDFEQSAADCGFLEVVLNGDAKPVVVPVRTDAPPLARIRVRHAGWHAALDVMPPGSTVLVSIEATVEEFAAVDQSALRLAADQVGSEIVVRRDAPPRPESSSPVAIGDDLRAIVAAGQWSVDRDDLIEACEAALDDGGGRS